MPVIEVVGLGARGWADLPDRLRTLVGAAEVLLGSPRHFALVPEWPGQRRLVWPSPLRDALPGLLAELGADRVVALASGDPLVAGIGSTLVEVLGAERVRVHPATSSVALARARMGWPAESVQVVRLRGGDLDQVRAALYDGRRLIVLSRDADTPAELAALLTAVGFGASVLTVLGDLDTDGETRRSAQADGWTDSSPPLNLVAVACVGPGLSLAPGLPDGAYDHDGQLTKRDVRASALAHLMPRPGELLWDVGAGAGSVGIEWLRAHPSCRALAVEQDPARAKRIRTNAAALGVPQLRVHLGAAPAALAGLPAPDAVFVGGGATAETLTRCWSALRPAGRLVAHAVTHETEVELAARWREHGGSLTRLSVEHLEPLGSHVAWRPARAIVQWSVGKGAP